MEMDPKNIHFDNEGLNPDSNDDGPTLPPGESVGEAASNIAAGFTPTGVTGRTQSAQSGGTRCYSWVWKHSTIVENLKNAQGINIGARAWWQQWNLRKQHNPGIEFFELRFFFSLPPWLRFNTCGDDADTDDDADEVELR
ncbi:hypothetical protein RHSIM_Rhsim05G0034300 [Rhododendron simsii]|uniref:Uncharacterized protein n=1 Tax=Rhododendron simsii TaxID=118357 RepID=A0A834LLV0_RHOSS|nr:hypothetical protein RHSIM_Rhsim05G0034300 [Rhododendron simsii]